MANSESVESVNINSSKYYKIGEFSIIVMRITSTESVLMIKMMKVRKLNCLQRQVGNIKGTSITVGRHQILINT